MYIPMNQVITSLLDQLRGDHTRVALEISLGTTFCGWLFDNFDAVCVAQANLEVLLEENIFFLHVSHLSFTQEPCMEDILCSCMAILPNNFGGYMQCMITLCRCTESISIRIILVT